MKIIFGAPGSGKTKAILELSAKNNIPVLCESQQRVRRLLEKASGYGYEIPMPITIEEIDDKVREVYVDDIQRVLEIALKIRLTAITVNKDKECEVSEL